MDSDDEPMIFYNWKEFPFYVDIEFPSHRLNVLVAGALINESFALTSASHIRNVSCRSPTTSCASTS